jgi:hypothetical protein
MTSGHATAFHRKLKKSIWHVVLSCAPPFRQFAHRLESNEGDPCGHAQRHGDGRAELVRHSAKDATSTVATTIVDEKRLGPLLPEGADA